MAESSDHELVEAAQGGDRRALDSLLRRHYPRIHLACSRILFDGADADDAAQNAMISIVRGLDSFDGRSAFSTWAYRIATNAALDEVRRRSRRPRGFGENSPEVVDERASRGSSAIDERDALERALRRLPPEFRTAVVLRDVLDLEYDAIAEILGVPIGTVRSRIARGRAGLAELLGNEAPDPRRQMDGT